MKHIFYLSAILFIIHELSWILNPKERVKKTKLFKELSKLHKGKKWDEYSNEYKSVLKSKGIPSLFFLLWMFIGLFSYNWIAFLLIILFNTIIIRLITKPFEYNLIYTSIHWLNSIIGFVFGVFIIINSYHLHIDLYEILITYWNDI